MKKISILSLHLGYGGIEKSIAALANILSEKYEVEIACIYKLYEKPAFEINKKVKIKYLLPNYKPNKKELKESIKKIQIIDISKESYKALKILYLRKKVMVDYIKNTDSKIIISTRDIFNFWLSDYAKTNVTKIGWEHNHYHDDYKYAKNIVMSAKRLDYLVLVSKSLCKYYKKELQTSNCKCVYIPNIIDNVPNKTSELIEKRIISVGRLSQEKGFIDLLKIFKYVLKDYPDWRLDIVGDGNEREKLEDYIKNNNLTKSVKIHGYQDKAYINNLLNKSSIYVMTSFTESFGIVLLEAMSYGIPCIAFDSAEGARELINSGDNGYLIKHRNYQAMIKKIEDLIKDKNCRIRIGKKGRESITKYTSKNVSKDWLNIIEK